MFENLISVLNVKHFMFENLISVLKLEHFMFENLLSHAFFTLKLLSFFTERNEMSELMIVESSKICENYSKYV